MEQELRRMFEIKETDMVTSPTLSPELRNRIGRQRIVMGGAVAATAFALVLGGFAMTSALSTDAAPVRPAEERKPPTEPGPEGLFADVGGWIAYRSVDGIWAVDPERPERRIRLSRADGFPIAWSNDGAKLLIQRLSPEGSDRPSPGLYVLETDGTETRLTERPFDASFSPDGSEVVYATSRAIYAVSSDGGAPRLIARATRQIFIGGRSYLSFIELPALSPDGTRIAYFDGYGDHSHNLRVMNADGTERRLVLDEEVSGAGHMNALRWSPDGEWLAFTTDDGIYLVRPDGTGFRLMVRGDFVQSSTVQWSPDE
ncbi:MAG TPA: hypothetical protein VE174_11205, partial [Actinomycetota bacterium]|nr:hypothetical protein [Actinomycetota bacterium]